MGGGEGSDGIRNRYIAWGSVLIATSDAETGPMEAASHPLLAIQVQDFPNPI